MSLQSVAYTSNDNFAPFNIKKQTMLNYFDAVNNNNKYYKIELHEKSGQYRIFTDYGRVGREGTKECRYADSEYIASKEFDRIFKEKTKKGYVEIDCAQYSKGSDEGTKIIDTAKVVIAPKKVTTATVDLEPEIIRLVKQFYDEAGKSLNTLIKGDNNHKGSPLGQLSVNQLDKGRKVLQEIADMVNTNKKNLTVEQAISISTEYYRHIPRAFGYKVNPKDVAIINNDMVSEQMDILKFYEDSLRMEDVIYDDSIMKQYNALHCDLKTLPKNDAKYKQIEKYFLDSQSKHHNFGLKVKNIFIADQKKAPKFDAVPGNIKELFHGTRSCNMIGILSSNLRLPNQLKGVYITGAMFGPGIYFADQSSKSAQYAFGRFSGLKNMYDSNFMFVTDVSLGKMKEEKSASYYYEPPKGYDSVKGCAGYSLLHNEFIVYKENRCQIRYIIEFTSNSRW